MNPFPRLAALTLVSSGIYLVWLLFTQAPFFFIVLETAIIFLTFLFIVNNRKRTYVMTGGPYSLRPIVDIFITIKNEDPHMFEKTVKSATEILYPNKRIYILDDGDRDSIRHLASKYQCVYLSRVNKEIKPFKAANLNNGLYHSYGAFILTLDADMKVNPGIFDNVLGFFNDENVAYVSTRQGFNLNPSDFNHENLFYEYMQTGKNTYGVGISTGSGVIYRRSALESIGGFQEWNIVEDLYTSYVLNSRGYRSVYVSQSFTYGDAPTNLSAIYKQRGIWAQDTLRMFIYKNPLLQKGLTFFQRLQYLEIGYSYIVSGVVFPLMYLTNIFSLVTNNPLIILGKEWYLILRIPSFIISLIMYRTFSKGTESMRMWAGLFPVYALAFMKALLYTKPRYKVTPKGLKPQKNITLILPQIAFILAGVTASCYHLFRYGTTWVLGINLFWVCVMIYFMMPIITKGLALSYEKNTHRGG